ncbi:13 kDa GIY-YIG-like endonuclease [Spodoptera frugiperda ascovirus 1a]|uniref:13 kDa GIY-YIG-like endonuclease n=1 Tax=Spodoptera frugiperda ascovirus 1a TaxID=113370 RepID=Q0E564_SFAVA|nr:13 kDa GIY-YIG-like endonuclease [Spodoptera frugiperda ascovirus 1a]CAL44637.1 13 kDa GIY-YIG-like endonuclease [Spodoptera frugiperda ascovirus 1a]
MADKNGWKLYMIQMVNGNIYTGASKDVERRFKMHCSGRGAKCLRGAQGLRLIWTSDETFTKSEALSLEYRLKRACDHHAKLIVSYCRPKDVRAFLSMTRKERSEMLKMKAAE